MPSAPHDYATGEVLTAAQMDKHPQGILALASATSNVGPTSGTTELDILTASAITFLTADRRIRLVFHCRGLSSTVSSDTFILRFKEGATILNEAHYAPAGTGVASFASDFSHIISSPSAASHTYKVTIQRALGTGTATVSATTDAPMLFTVEDAGQA